MILDDLCDMVPALGRIVQGSHVVEVPFEVCPVSSERGVLFDWRETGALSNIVPRIPGKRWAIDASHLRLPYDRLVLFNPREHGVVLIQRLSKHLIEEQTFGRTDTDIIDRLRRVHPELKDAPLENPAGGKALDGWHYWAVGRWGRVIVCVIASRQYVVEHHDQVRLASAMDVDANGEMLRQFNAAIGSEFAGCQCLHAKIEDWEFDRNNTGLAVVSALNVMNCRNVRMVPGALSMSRQQRRLRTRRGQLPPFSYHRLVIDSRTRRRTSLVAGGDGEPLALHWTRGHFKDYREGGGLFGTLHGLYWWSPTLSGKADRIVTKEYVIDLPRRL